MQYVEVYYNKKGRKHTNMMQYIYVYYNKKLKTNKRYAVHRSVL